MSALPGRKSFSSPNRLESRLIAAASDPDLQLKKAAYARYDLATALQMDGVGDLKPPILPASLITTDNVPDAPDTSGNTNPTITVTGPGVTTPIVSTIDTIGDQDFYKVTLTAGTAYEFGLYAYTGGPNAVGLTDAFLELYAANGTTMLVSADGGANTVYNQANSGFDVLLVYTPTTSGTFYINARAFSNSPATTNGDSVGDYQLFVRQQDSNDPNIYTPYYEPTEPLYAIDWGTQVNKINQSARNPDGNEGTRGTGNAQGTPVYTSLLDIPALAAAQGKDITGKNVITIYFAKPGDVFASNDPTNPGLPPATVTAVEPQGFEITAVWTALAEFEKVADVVYLEVQDKNHADFIYTSYQGTPGPGVSLLGSMSPPDESDEGMAQFNSGDSRWNSRDLAQGGFSFVTLIHEFGHGHGLAHPHDNGGRSGIMNGVVAEGAGIADYTTGDFGLNQGVFTMMSYEDGWQDSPYGNASTSAGYGYLGSLMAFDIAAIQDKYGVNENWATGNDTYTLKDVNAAGTFYSSIWDGGGTDEIVYIGSRDTTIDLRAATLVYETGGGGRVSYALGIYGGFTIANGVTIENATSGSGNDTLIGNAADNRLDGGGGVDTLYFQHGGNDTGIGGDGNDGFWFGATLTGGDFVDGGAGNDDQVGMQGNYSGLIINAANFVGIETFALLGGDITTFGDPGTNFYDYNITTAGSFGRNIIVNANGLRAGEDFTFNGSAETTGSFTFYGGFGVETLTGGAGNDGFYFGPQRFAPGDTVNGGGGSDNQLGLRGDYTIDFNAPGFVGVITNIQTIALLSDMDPNFTPIGDGEFDYTVILSDGNVGAGLQLTVSGGGLGTTETMVVDGSAETNGTLRLIGGAATDTLTGGAGADAIFGGLANDTLRGNGGADSFIYTNVNQSAPFSGFDSILDFTHDVDKVNLSVIDANIFVAGDQAFSFIGAAAFSGTGAASAGELRAVLGNPGENLWQAEADINGDGVADFLLLVVVQSAQPLTSGGFCPLSKTLRCKLALSDGQASLKGFAFAARVPTS